MGNPLQPVPSADGVWITGYGPGSITLNGVQHRHPVLVVPHAQPPIRPWPYLRLEDTPAEALAALAEESPEVLMLGTGSRQAFLSPNQMRALPARRFGIECMTTPAACRTFGVLAAEGRRIVAVLYPPEDLTP